MVLHWGERVKQPTYRHRYGRIADGLIDKRGIMIVVRNCFVAKPGNASKLAAQLKEAVAVSGIPKFRVLTDLTGDFNRVVMEFEAENVGEFEARMKEYSTNSQFREK